MEAWPFVAGLLARVRVAGPRWLLAKVMVAALAGLALLSIGVPPVDAATVRRAEGHVSARCGAARSLLAVQTRLIDQTKGLSFLPQNFFEPITAYLMRATNDACAGRFSAQGCQTGTGPPTGAYPQYAIVSVDWHDARSFAHAANQPVWEARFSNAMWTVTWDAATRIVPPKYLRWCDYDGVGATAWILEKWMVARQVTVKAIAMLQAQPTFPLKSVDLANAEHMLYQIDHHLPY
jgi:hypothetical protein